MLISIFNHLANYKVRSHPAKHEFSNTKDSSDKSLITSCLNGFPLSGTLLPLSLITLLESILIEAWEDGSQAEWSPRSQIFIPECFDALWIPASLFLFPSCEVEPLPMLPRGIASSCCSNEVLLLFCCCIIAETLPVIVPRKSNFHQINCR